MIEGAGGERKEGERKSPEQRIIDFVNRIAVLEGGRTADIVRSVVLEAPTIPGALITAMKVETGSDPAGDEDVMIYDYVIEAVLPGGVRELILADETQTNGSFGWLFVGPEDDVDVQYGLGAEQRRALVESFFLRYGLVG